MFIECCVPATIVAIRQPFFKSWCKEAYVAYNLGGDGFTMIAYAGTPNHLPGQDRLKADAKTLTPLTYLAINQSMRLAPA